MNAPRFSRKARIVILIGAGLAFSSAISNVFVSMYLYRWLDGLAALTVFNLGQFMLMPVGFYGAAHVARRIGNRGTLSLGLFLFVIFYGLLVILGDTSSRHLVPLGILNGLANGFFWFPFNILTARAAEESDKGRFFGVSAALSSAANAVGPLVSTLAISLAPKVEMGYTILFLSIVAVMAGMTISALALPGDSSREPIEVIRHLRRRGSATLPVDRKWRYSLEMNFTYGLRDGANWSVMSILILQGAGSETVAGYLAVGFAVVGISLNYLIGAVLSSRRYSIFWGWGSVTALASALVISLSPTLLGAVASGVLWKATEALVFLPFNAVFYGILAGYIRTKDSVAGRNISTEIVLNTGRAIGAGSFLLLSFFTSSYAQILFPLLTLAVPATWLIYRRHSSDLVSGS
jgi:YQGE family putative transporter